MSYYIYNSFDFFWGRTPPCGLFYSPAGSVVVVVVLLLGGGATGCKSSRHSGQHVRRARLRLAVVVVVVVVGSHRPPIQLPKHAA